MTNEGARRGLHHARLEPSGRSFPVREDQTLLAGAEAAGLQLANSCRNGTCRTCLRPLRSGSVHYRIEWPGLLPEERASGAWVLPCVAYATSDVVLGD